MTISFAERTQNIDTGSAAYLSEFVVRFKKARRDESDCSSYRAIQEMTALPTSLYVMNIRSSGPFSRHTISMLIVFRKCRTGMCHPASGLS